MYSQVFRKQQIVPYNYNFCKNIPILRAKKQPSIDPYYVSNGLHDFNIYKGLCRVASLKTCDSPEIFYYHNIYFII